MIRILAFLAISALPAAASAQSLLDGDTRSPNDPPERPALEKRDHLRIEVLAQDLGTFAGFRPAAGHDGEAAAAGFVLAAEVVDVRPNGNLVIQATRRRTVNDGENIIHLTGEVAPGAVVEGCVRSDSILNLDVACTATGSAKGSGGCWLGRALSSLWPF